MQVVLDVGNALNAGTNKGNALGFRVGTLLKLAELKAQDKKTTLLHFTADVVNKSAPELKGVLKMKDLVGETARVPLEELGARRL